MALTTTPQTTPTLLSINSDEPVMVTENGQGLAGILWIVQPEHFDTTVEFVNRYGGPSAYRITPLSQLDEIQMHRITTERPEELEYVQRFQK